MPPNKKRPRASRAKKYDESDEEIWKKLNSGSKSSRRGESTAKAKQQGTVEDQNAEVTKIQREQLHDLVDMIANVMHNSNTTKKKPKQAKASSLRELNANKKPKPGDAVFFEPSGKTRDSAAPAVDTRVMSADESLNTNTDGTVKDPRKIIYPITLEENKVVGAELERQGVYADRPTKVVMLQTPTLCLLMGESWAGKTHMMEYLLKYLWLDGRWRFGIVWVPTKFRNSYGRFITRDDMVQEAFTEDKLWNWLEFLKAQHKIEQDRYRRLGLNPTDAQCPPSFMVFDDIVGALYQQSTFWEAFLSTYRHYNITLFVATQDVKKVAPILRKQAQHIFLWRLESFREVDELYRTYCEWSFPRRSEFVEMYKNFTFQPYQCMWIRHVVKSEFPKERYLTFRAPSDIDEALKQQNPSITLPIKIDVV